MNNLISTHIPLAAKSRALGMAFTGFHSGDLCLIYVFIIIIVIIVIIVIMITIIII